MKRVTFLKAALTLPAPYAGEQLSEGNSETSQGFDMQLLDASEAPGGVPCIHVIPLEHFKAKELYIPLTLCIYRLAEDEHTAQVVPLDIEIVQLPKDKYHSRARN